MKKLNKGFTIIELLIVIAIIGILATTLAPKLIKEIRKATVAKVQHNLGVIRSRLSLDETLSDKFPDLTGEENTNSTVSDYSDLLKAAYSIKPTPGFTDENGSHGESSKVVNSRDDKGGWYYIRETGKIFANLPNGAYTKDEEYEIWNGEDSNSIVYDFSGIDLTDSLELNNFINNNEGWFSYNSKGEKAMTLNPYKEYSIKTTTTFTGTEATSAGYGIYIQTQINTNGNLDGYIFQYDEGLGKLVIKQLVDSSETGNNIYLDTSVIDDFYPDNDVWWTTKHSIQIDVTDSTTDSTKQNVKISIDNNVISNSYSSNYGGTAIANDHLTIDKPVETNYTGFRTWNVTKNGNNFVNTTVDVDSVSITEL